MKSRIVIYALGGLLALPSAWAGSGQQSKNQGKYLDRDSAAQLGGVGNYVYESDKEVQTEVKAEAGLTSEYLSSVNEGLRFESGSAEVEGQTREELSRVADSLASDPEQKLTITGHADSTGPAELNEELALKRADSVKQELVANGAREEQIEVESFGESKPVADNSDSMGRAQNRRVELDIG